MGEERRGAARRHVGDTMGFAYEARVAVRGELASPKSFPRLIHNKDDRDKRETHPRTLAHVGTKKSQNATN